MGHIFFDLDGTLVDSAPSILSALREAFQQCHVSPACALDASLVGPPLTEIIARLMGDSNAAVQNRILESFKRLYDTSFCIQAQPFAGIVDALVKLSVNNTLYVVTNKRLAPTKRIVEHLGWQQYFAALYSPDSFSPPIASKAAVLKAVLAQWGLEGRHCVYVGDTVGDWKAATANDMPCLFVEHGYGQPDPAVQAMQTFSVQALVRQLLPASKI